ncbi:MAG: HAD-IC family P-type ATPase [Thermoanaerobacteraceae bacterium]|nr:HAD-IC family P-type ATPase [Thermoanaerobacteraceae bacterium]
MIKMDDHDRVVLPCREEPAGKPAGSTREPGEKEGVRKTIQGGFNRALLWRAFKDAFVKLHPRLMWGNPVMFVVEIVAVLTTFFTLRDAFGGGAATLWFDVQIAAWLWITVLFANFAEALAEGRGKAQAESLRRTRRETRAKRLLAGGMETVPSSSLRKGDVVLVQAGEVIPGDGEVIEGIASVDESAVTGESAPVIRESGGDRSSVTGGTRVLSDWIKVRITANPGETFLDRMILSRVRAVIFYADPVGSTPASPPVTELRSPPDSANHRRRLLESALIHKASPSITSPSPG